MSRLRRPAGAIKQTGGKSRGQGKGPGQGKGKGPGQGQGKGPGQGQGKGPSGLQATADAISAQSSGDNNAAAHGFAAAGGGGGGGGSSSGGKPPVDPLVYNPILIIATNHVNAFGSTININVTGLAPIAGDLILTHVTRRTIGSHVPAFTAPSGFTEVWLEGAVATVSNASAMYWKVALGGDSDVTAGVPGGDWSGSFSWLLRGVDPANPVEVVVSVIDTSSPMDMASLEASRINSLLVAGCNGWEGLGAPATTLAVLDDSDKHTTGDGYVHGEAHEFLLVEGPSGIKNFTATGVASATRICGGMCIINPVLS